MANNIQIVGNILNSTIVSRYNNDDVRLISSQEIQQNFGDAEDYIEYYVYDAGGNLLTSNIDYKNFKLPSNSGLTPYPNTSTSNTTDSIPLTDVGIVSNTNTQSGSLYPIIEIDPVLDLQNLGYNSGEFSVRYNFFTNKISSPQAELFIKEISPDRTEIGIISTILSDEEIEEKFNLIINEISSSIYFSDYLLNFGNNQQVLAVNIALNKLDSGFEIYFKLYEPLPDNITEKTPLWVVDEKIDPYVFNINLDTLILPPTGSQLRGPNFNIPIDQQGTISTEYENYDNLLNNLQSLQNSSYSKILNLISTQSIDININYTNFSEFSFFGSVEQRLKNFYSKIKQIEDYNTLISNYTPYVSTTSSLALEISSSKNNINDIISKFDGFEYYLYFESSSYTWPKSTSTLPYQLYSTSSLIAETWYNNYTSSAKTFDENNVNSLKNSIPSFLIDDCNNQYLIFLDMIGQYFDNIWIFLKSITDVNLANNNLEEGVSKDLVYHVLKSYGVKLYNDQGGEGLNQFLIGQNSGSVNFDNDFSPTGSYLNNIPRKDLLAELYKRIYHNLPYLVKNKGTVAGLEGLITVFGVTGSILNTKEFGGSTKSELLKGYSNEKVRIISNTITGSALSPFISLNQPPTSSNEFRDDDLHYLDVSFSPQSQIDTYISGAIASNNPTFNLDDYIGDPRQQYSSSYADLEIQQKLYFETGVPGYPAFTGSNMDYNGFIRLIQFFDNALFKMIADFVPARTSLSTGITINSPVLERNKVSYSKPLINNQEIYDAEFEGPQIVPQYGFLYNNLTGSKSAFYNGELSGSQINIYDTYFLPSNNDNFYLHPTASLTPTDINNFIRSDFNVLLNNISGSRPSLLKKDIEFIIDNTGSLSNRIILSQAELQDSYESLVSYNNSRHEGTKITSQKYNDYSLGDISFGKTSVIDHHVRKIGLFTQIESSSFFPQRNNIALKYLVDENGNLTELNQRNKNWEEVQNTFILGYSSSISLFDNEKYSNQKQTDGNKLIYSSGYSYNPILYLSKNTTQLSFLTPGFQPNINLLATNNGSNFNITGSSSNFYPLSPINKIISNFAETEDEVASNNFQPGIPGVDNFALLPIYTSNADTLYNINVQSNIQVTESLFNNNGYVTYALEIFRNNSTNPLLNLNSPVTSSEKTFVYNDISVYNPSSNKIWSQLLPTTRATYESQIPSIKISDGRVTAERTRFSTSETTQQTGVFTGRYSTTITISWTDDIKGGEIIRLGTALRQDRRADFQIPYDIRNINANDRANYLATLFLQYIWDTDTSNTDEPNPNNFYMGLYDVLKRDDPNPTSPAVDNISPNSFSIRFVTTDSSTSNTIGEPVIEAFESYRILSPMSSIVLGSDIVINNNKIYSKGQTLYKYNVLEFDGSSTTSQTIYHSNSSLRLYQKENILTGLSQTLPNKYYPKTFTNTVNERVWGFYEYFNLPIEDLESPPITIGNDQILDKVNDGNLLTFNLSLLNYFLPKDDKLTFVLREKEKFSDFSYKSNFSSSLNNQILIEGNPNVLTIFNNAIALFDPNPNLSKRQDPNNNNFTTLYLTSSLSSIYNTSSSLFIAENSDLYSKYGDVNSDFAFEIGDSLVIKDNNNFTYEFVINKIIQNNNSVGFQLSSTMELALFSELFNTNVNKRYFEVLYLKRRKDENNIIINFNKKDGKTSYGFIIPPNLHPDVLKNIDIITKEVKQKLLADQQGQVTN